MEHHDVASGVIEGGRGLAHAGEELRERDVMRARHSQPGNVRLNVARKPSQHFLLDLTIRRRDDQANPRARSV
jgi:hypothetical protein